MFTLAKYKSAVTIHDRIDDVSEVVEMITEDVIDSKELSHLWSEGLEIINNITLCFSVKFLTTLSVKLLYIFIMNQLTTFLFL